MKSNKVYFEQGAHFRGYKPFTSYLKIYSNSKGSYFNLKGRKIYFDDVPRLAFPIMPLDEDGRPFVIGGYLPVSNCLEFLVELHPDCESVRVWEEIEY